MRWLVAVATMSVSLACSSDSVVPTSVSIYEPCFLVEDCVETATLCEELVVEFGGFEYTNAICTTECATGGPVSPDCARAFVGRPGSCYPSSVAGGVDDTPICFEPCDSSVDCLFGFRCLGAVDLCGADLAACPISPTDSICVPGPS